MKNKDINLSVKDLGPQLQAAARSIGHYAGMLFFVLVAGVYGFVVMQIGSLSNVQPDQAAIDSQVGATTSIPKVDPKIAKQLESLKDNSTNVQSLFEEARQNPFQE